MSPKDFNHTLLRYAGRKFGAESFCRRGSGGLQLVTLSEKLQELELAKRNTSGAPKQFTELTPSVPLADVAPLANAEPFNVREKFFHTPKPARVLQLTPSKRSAQSDGADLEALLSHCKTVMFDPQLASPFRRSLRTFAHRALTDVLQKAKSLQQGETETVAHSGRFECKATFTYNPNFSPERMMSAAETKRKTCLPAKLAVGNEEMQMTSLQKAHNERRLSHSLAERSQRIQDNLAGRNKK